MKSIKNVSKKLKKSIKQKKIKKGGAEYINIIKLFDISNFYNILTKEHKNLFKTSIIHFEGKSNSKDEIIKFIDSNFEGNDKNDLINVVRHHYEKLINMNILDLTKLYNDYKKYLKKNIQRGGAVGLVGVWGAMAFVIVIVGAIYYTSGPSIPLKKNNLKKSIRFPGRHPRYYSADHSLVQGANGVIRSVRKLFNN